MVFVLVEEVLQSFALAEDQSEDGQRFAVLEVEVSIVEAVVAAAVEVAVEYVSAVVAIVVAAEQSRSNRRPLQSFLPQSNFQLSSVALSEMAERILFFLNVLFPFS